ncbi:hypothetical protein TorRG33x02_352690, partial [Trema orientale]
MAMHGGVRRQEHQSWPRDVERRSPEADGVASSGRQEPTARSSGSDSMSVVGFKGRSREKEIKR